MEFWHILLTWASPTTQVNLYCNLKTIEKILFLRKNLTTSDLQHHPDILM